MRVQALEKVVHVLIVEDDVVDAAKMQAALRMLMGTAVAVTIVGEPKQIEAAVRSRRPDIVLLDDRMPDGSGAEATVPALRAAGFEGHVLLVSGLLSRLRQAALGRLGGIDAIIHKDEADSVSLTEAILDALERPPVRNR
jgi:DNA-binding NarL/FixJ family response regulator